MLDHYSMQYIKLIVCLFFIVVSLAACKTIDKNSEATVTEIRESNNNLSLETTIAGNTEEPYLDGNAHIYTSGVPFTEEEILQQVTSEMKMDIIPEDCQISTNGYYHVNAETNCLDYNFLTLPMLQNGKLCGEMALQRKKDGAAEVAKIAFSDNEDKLCELLEANPQKEFAMVYAGVSEYAILEDNTVYTISGYSPHISNIQNLYNAYNLEDNILSYEIIGDIVTHNTCDISVLNTEHKPIVDLYELLIDNTFQQQVKDYFSSEPSASNMSGCYFSVCGAEMYNINTNKVEKAMQCFIFTQDLEEVGTLHFNMDGSKLITSYSINSGTRSALLKRLSEKPDERFVILTDGFNNVMLLNKDNKTIKLSAGSEDFTIIGDCFGLLSGELGLAYNDIVNEDNLVWVGF